MKRSKAKSERPRRQYGAVPFRVGDDGELEVMLITSLERGRWIVPKGWPKKAGPRPTARAEAFEEAGLRGKVLRRPLGTFKYDKLVRGGASIPCKLRIYPLAAKKQAKTWPEKKRRTTTWFPVDKAVRLCSDPALGVLLSKLRTRLGMNRVVRKPSSVLRRERIR